MADTSKIEWTDTTWNPSTGCDKVSPGCGIARPGSNDEATGQTGGCYAMSLAKRLKAMGSEKYQNDGDPRTSGPGFGVTAHPDVVTAPLSWRKPRKVFVNSMSDLFHDDIPDAFIARVFAVMAATPQHTYQVLTKRHGRMRSLLSAKWFPELVTTWARRDGVRPSTPLVQLPAPNIWLGVSVEDQKWADVRIPALLDTPASVRFISAEPLLGPVDLAQLATHSRGPVAHWEGRDQINALTGVPRDPSWTSRPGIDWVIVGGESGPGSRPMHPDWVRTLRDQCTAAGTAFFFKQFGAWAPESAWLHRDSAPAAFLDVDGRFRPLVNGKPTVAPMARGQAITVRQIGKKQAGRTLDGRTWDEFPQPVGVS
jgi:protein gp37